MEVVVGIAVGVLVVVVLFSSICIAVVVKKKCCRKPKDESTQQPQNNPDRQLIEEAGDDISITLQNVLDDDIWIDDMTGVMNHCIPILKSCHDLTSRLVPVTVKASESEEDNKKIEQVALEVQPRLDDVVQLLEGPLDPRLIEARCTSLYYAVSNLCLVIKSICKDAEDISSWIDSSLHDVEGHLKILQAETQNLYRRSSVTESLRGRVGKNPSQVCELSLSGTHSNSSSHTDSAESGIDLETPSERGSQHSPNSPSYQIAPEKGLSKGLKHGSTIVEVHVEDTPQSGEVIEMNSFSNGGYTVATD